MTRAPRFALLATTLVIACSTHEAPVAVRSGPLPASPSVASNNALAKSAFRKRSPIRFEQNLGQFGGPSRFVSRAGSGTVAFDSNEVRIAKRTLTGDARVLTTRFAGGNAKDLVGESPSKGETNYLIGNDRSRWVRHVSTFDRVRYREIYPGVDAVYYGKDNALEYDLEVAPGADPGRIALEFPGATKVWLDKRGDVHAISGGEEAILHAPVSYQLDGANHRSVWSHFQIDTNDQVRLVFGDYDRSKALVIDPILEFATYLGGSGADFATTVALDSSGYIYLAGSTQSLDFPLESAPRGASEGADFFVTKFEPDGRTVVYSTYLGGSRAETSGVFLAVDSTGTATLLGGTLSEDFPSTNGVVQPLHAAPGGAANNLVIATLTPKGDALGYATFLGGTADVSANGVALSANGDVFIVGSTSGVGFPMKSPLQALPSGGLDIVLARLSASGTVLNYATYIGGAGDDVPSGLAVSATGEAFVTGTTSSANFPTVVGSFSPTPFANRDVFVTKVLADGSAFAYSTYLGGTSDDSALAIALGVADSVFVGGYTSSTDFPTTMGAPKRALTGGVDGFVAALDPTGATVTLSTLIGGTSPIATDSVSALAIENTGAILIGGSTTSLDFPVAVAPQSGYGGNAGGLSPSLPPGDAFLSRLDPSNGQYTFSTYIGGSGDEAVFSVVSDIVGSIYVAGATTSPDFPIRNAVDPTFNGGVVDTFLAKFSSCNADYGSLGSLPIVIACESSVRPACDLASRSCVECSSTNASVCTGAKPFCDTAIHACVAALKDSDGDGISDQGEAITGTDPYLEDSDGDGSTDAEECSALGSAGPFTGIDTDGDGWIDALDTDSDNDSVPDSLEKMVDIDGDGIVNFRDTDDDGDGLLTRDEVRDTRSIDASNDVDGDGLMNWYDVDADGDGKTDSAEGRGDSDRDGIPDYLDANDRRPTLDSDGDGLSDEVEIRIGTDPHDRDSDHDSLSDTSEAPGGTPIDSDGDSTIDALDNDDDNDSIPTRTEVSGALTWNLGEDIDADGVRNWLDDDSDGDGSLDSAEGVGDQDEDGIPNYQDADDATRIRLEGGGFACSSQPASSGGSFSAVALMAVVAVVSRGRRASRRRA